MTKQDRLDLWQARLDVNEAAYKAELARMDEREEYYRGTRQLRTLVEGVETFHTAYNVRNIVAENIESVIDSSIPQPKVTPRREQDEEKAKIIENMIRNELDRLRSEELNDMQERTVPIQGGGYWHIEWDSDAASHGIAGEVALGLLHPKQVIPQDGVVTAVEDMDYIIIRLPQTKAYIKRRYGVDVDDESEDEPGLRGLDGETVRADELVTQNIAYFRSEHGEIGLYSWCNNRELAYYDDYQARRTKRCASCGALKPVSPQAAQEMAAIQPGTDEDQAAEERLARDLWETGRELGAYQDAPAGAELETDAPDEDDAERCPYCGGHEWREGAEDFEEIYLPIQSTHGVEIPGATWGLGDIGQPVLRPTRIPAYKPDCYPVVLQRNVSVYGRLLGDSDVDKIADLQNSINWLNAKIDDRLMGAGTIITGPARTDFAMDPEDRRIMRLDNMADKAMIDTYEFSGDVSSHFLQLQQSYEAARQILGITDSFQGRKDSTATSGKAKEFAAAQSAGRMESKRRMKDAAWSKLFELIFKFRLAYADEPRPVVSQDERGDSKYDSFDRYDFLERDPETGEWWWNDQFLFSCDTSAPLAANREAMWQEARLNLTGGAYGDPASYETLLLFWSEMEKLHYPLAASARQFIEQQLEAQRQAAMMQQQMMQQAAMMPGVLPGTVPGRMQTGTPMPDMGGSLSEMTL